MANIIKIVFILFFLLIVFVSLFYFWGKQSQYTTVDYVAVQYSGSELQKGTDTLDILTYNIGYLSGMTNNLPVHRPKELIESNQRKAIELFQQLNASIIAVQEIDFGSKRTFNKNQFQQIIEEVPFCNGAMAVNWDKKYVPFPYWPIKHHFGEIYSGQALFSDLSIISNERMVLPQPSSNSFVYNDFYLDRLAQITWLKYQNTKMLFINVHFEAWDGATREAQADLVLDLFRQYMNDFPVILVGDFNCPPPFSENAFQEKTIDELMDEPGLDMCLQTEKYLNNPSHYFTFNSENPYQKIDYIFYNSKFFDCLETRVVFEASDISDHLPVWARLKYHASKP
jgi:endonuclease/exonuclease/phosphatase family metal-dependent hydrolase